MTKEEHFQEEKNLHSIDFQPVVFFFFVSWKTSLPLPPPGLLYLPPAEFPLASAISTDVI